MISILWICALCSVGKRNNMNESRIPWVESNLLNSHGKFTHLNISSSTITRQLQSLAKASKYARLWPGHWASPSYHIQHHTSNILYRRKSKETWSPIHFSVVVLFCFCHFIVFCGKFVSSVNMKHILHWPNDKIMRKFLLLYVECCIDFINCPKRLAFCSLSFYPCHAPILPPQILCVYDVFTL